MDTTPILNSSTPHSSTNKSLEGTHIAISGLIGAGKTTLAIELGKVLNLPTYFEEVIDNLYLQDFYSDPKKYSFQLQIYLLNSRFQQQQQIIWQAKGGVQDRTIYEDSVFAKMLMESGLIDQRDYNTYCKLFQNLSNFMRRPDLIIHLDVSPEDSLERIKKRNRDCEKHITIEYLRNLYQAYQEFLQDISRYIAVIRVNWSEFHDVEQLAKMIKLEYESMRFINNIHPVSKNVNNENINK